MSPQVRFVRESFLASRVSAGVGLLASVDPDVVGEEPGPGECLGAVGTLVVPVVGLHVHRQGRHGGVELAAVSAVFPSVGVDLSVSGEVAAGGEHLSTVGAALCLLSVATEAWTEAGTEAGAEAEVV